MKAGILKLLESRVGRAAAFVAAASTVLGGTWAAASAVGYPWAPETVVSALEKRVAANEVSQRIDHCQLIRDHQNGLFLLLGQWQQRLREAEDEIRTNPSSPSAREQRSSSDLQVRQIEWELNHSPPPC